MNIDENTTIEISGGSNDFKIEESKKSLHLVPLTLGKKRLIEPEEVYVSVDTKYAIMRIGKNALTAMGMGNRWYRLFFDSTKCVIAWNITDKLDTSQAKKAGWRFAKPDKSSGDVSVSIKRILDTFMGIEKKTYRCKLQKYKDKGIISTNETYYFVEVMNK